MKRYFLIVLLLMLLASIISAQEADKIKYENLAIGKDGFSVDVPKDFRLMYFDKKEDKYRFYGYYSSEFYLFILSDKKTEFEQNQFLINLASENKAKISNLSLKNFEAKRYEFFDAEGFYQKIIIVPDKKRNLVFHTVSTTNNNPSVKKFFSSLKFDNVPIPTILSKKFFDDEPVKEEKTIVPIADSENDTDKKTGNGSGVGSGSGIGSGQGSGSGNQTKKSSKPNGDGKTSGLRLLSKPRPGYTDMARTYNLQGTVTLRVTFLANGEIGSVSPVQKLPFGLTLKAINAAKQFQFEPAQRNGVSYSVTKSVQFSFTIY